MKSTALTPKKSYDREAVVTVAPHVMHRELDGESVLLNLESGVYYGLNETGTRIWALMGQSASLGAIHDRLLKEFSVRPDELWRDLIGIVRELLEKQLARVDSGGSPAMLEEKRPLDEDRS